MLHACRRPAVAAASSRGSVVAPWAGETGNGTETVLKACFPRTLVVAASSRGGLPDEGDGAALKAGMLVEYRKDTNKHVLVLLAEPNGKINWFGVDAVRGIWGGGNTGCC